LADIPLFLPLKMVITADQQIPLHCDGKLNARTENGENLKQGSQYTTLGAEITLEDLHRPPKHIPPALGMDMG
jgi:hypothetical protein